MLINLQQEIIKCWCLDVTVMNRSCISVYVLYCAVWFFVPPGCALLERVDDLSVLAQLTDESFLSTQTAAEDMRAGELDHFGQEGSQFAIDHLQGDGRKRHGQQQQRLWDQTLI